MKVYTSMPQAKHPLDRMIQINFEAEAKWKFRFTAYANMSGRSRSVVYRNALAMYWSKHIVEARRKVILEQEAQAYPLITKLAEKRAKNALKKKKPAATD